MKLITRLSILTSIGVLLIIFLSGCGSKGNTPVVISDNEITVEVGIELDWTNMIVVEDDVDTDLIIDESMIDLSNLNMYDLGTYTVIYNITDSDENTTEFVLTVNVVDSKGPLVFLTGDQIIYLTIGEEYIEPGVTIFDNFDSDLVYDVIGSVDTNTIGGYYLNYTVTDSSGNTSALITRLVVVENYKQMVTSSDDVYFTLDDFTITKEDLFDKMINYTGLYLLLDYVDTMILSDFIDAVTSEELIDELNILTFLTTDQDEIDDLEPSVYQDSVDMFNRNLIESGYDPENLDDVNEYLSLRIAKRNAFLDYYETEQLDSKFYPNYTLLEDYYDTTVKGDVCALELRFHSKTEAVNVFNHFNIVFDFNEGFGEYVGGIPIEEVNSFSSINTIQLSNEDAFSYFVKIYNYINPNNVQLPEDITKEDLCVNYSEFTHYVYSDITDDYTDYDIYFQYIDYIYEDLNTLYDIYSYQPMTFGGNEMFAYKISQEEVTGFNELSLEEKDALEEEYIIENLSQNDLMIEEFMIGLRDDLDFNIIEQSLGILYESDSYSVMDRFKDPILMATIGEEVITADMFYDYAESRLGVKYTVDLLARHNLLNNGIYVEQYGENFDVLTNDSEQMVEYRAQLLEIRESFESGMYEVYGFTLGDYTWGEFMLLALNSKTEAEVLMNLFIFQNLTAPGVMSDYDFDLINDYIQYHYDNFFSLDVEHLLLYIDFDNDFIPDDYPDYVEGLDESQLLEFNSLKTSFEALVRIKYDQGMTLGEIVNEYNGGLINDETYEWAIFKQYGFRLLIEDLTTYGESLDTINTAYFDSSFVSSLKRIYDEYLLLQNNSVEDIPTYFDSLSTESVFGIHFILASKGDDFEQPTAFFDQDNSDVIYSEGSHNLGVLPTQEQLTIYKTIPVNEQTGIEDDLTLPDSVSNAIDYYYIPVFENAVFVNSFLIEAAEDIVNGDQLFTNDNLDNIQKVLRYYEMLLDIINDY